jgi:hypothetical protein
MMTSCRSPGTGDKPPGVQDADAARDAPRHHCHVLDPPGQIAFVQDFRAKLADQVADPRPRELGAMRHCRDEAELCA